MSDGIFSAYGKSLFANTSANSIQQDSYRSLSSDAFNVRYEAAEAKYCKQHKLGLIDN